MAGGNGAAIDVGLVGIESELVDAVDRLACESLVDLDKVDVVERDARLFEQLGYCDRGTDPHHIGVDPSHRPVADKCDRLETHRFGRVGAHDHNCAGAVVDL